jgi:spore maturation protein CgeB
MNIGNALNEKEENKERFLVVSNHERFASTSVFDGISNALNSLGFTALQYCVHEQQATFSTNFICNDLISHAVSVRNMFTHVLFVGSTFVPEFVIQSIQRCGVKVIFWGLEGTHSTDLEIPFYGLADYYLSNDRATKKNENLKNSEYLPTAGDHTVYGPIDSRVPIPEGVRKDVVFCGNIYPNRQKILEAIVPFIKEKGYTMGIAGITGLMVNKKDSPLLPYILFDKVVDPSVFVKIYGASKIAINIIRDSFYEANPLYTNKIYKIKGESLNPSAYEIGLTGTPIQLIDSSRAELYDGQALKIGDHCDVFESSEVLCQKIEYYMTHEEERNKISLQAREYCLKNNTYLSRAERLIKIIRIKEMKHEQLIKSINDKLLDGKIEIEKK